MKAAVIAERGALPVASEFPEPTDRTIVPADEVWEVLRCGADLSFRTLSVVGTACLP
jgi:hypothetical protein